MENRPFCGNLHGGGKIMTGNELPILVFFLQTHPTHDLLEHSTHTVTFASKEGAVSMQKSLYKY